MTGGSVVLPVGELPVYMNWLDMYFGGSVTHGKTGTALSPSASNADPNGDGIPNLLEYVFGTNPVTGKSAADMAKLPCPSTEIIDDETYFIYSFNLSSHSTASLVFEGRASLGNVSWQTVVPDITETGDPDPVTLDRTIKYKVKMSTSPAQFFRLRASL